MTPELNQAKHLVEAYGKERAVEHAEYVLGYEFGLWKIELRVFWTKVLSLIKEF